MIETLQQLYPTATREQIRNNQKALIKNAIDNGYGDDKRFDDMEEEIDREQQEFEMSVEADKKDHY